MSHHAYGEDERCVRCDARRHRAGACIKPWTQLELPFDETQE